MQDTKENFEKMLVELYKIAEELGITEEELEDDEELESDEGIDFPRD